MADKTLKIMIAAAQAGGKILKKYFGRELEVTIKSMPADFQTKADIESERAVVKILSRHFPGYNINAEERGVTDKGSEYTFYLDPLDGSNNFVIGIPNFSVGLALAKNNEVIYSVIHNPMINQTFCAAKGKGAYLNGQRIKVNKEEDIKRATVSYIPSYIHDKEYANKVYRALYMKKSVKRFLKTWSVCIDFCLLASGKIEAIIVNGTELHDHIPCKLIAREAGALVTGWEGRIDKEDLNNKFIASNGTKIHEQIRKVL